MFFPNSSWWWVDGSDFLGNHAPAVGALVPDTGKQRDLVIPGGGKAAGIRFTDLGNRHHLISPGTQLGGQFDGVPVLQLMNAAKVVVYATVMGGEAGVSIPDGSVLKMGPQPFFRAALSVPS